jgi:putative ABC transport system permease protein
VLLFPMLFVAGMAGLAGRALARALPAVRLAGTAWRPSLYLAARRVAAAPRMTVLLVTAIAIALGILVYASSLAGSVRGSLADKALVLNGAPTRVVLAPDSRGIPERLAVPATEVIRARAATIQPAGTHVDLLGIDRSTFLRAVPDSALRLDRSPAEAIASLPARLGERIPVLVAGGSIPPGASLDVGPLRLRLRTAVRGAAFPGMTPGRPLVVLDRAALQAAIRTGQTSVGGLGADREAWSSAQSGDVVRALRRASVPVQAVTTTARLRGDPSFTPVSWIFGLLQALGVLAGLVASIGVLLYMQARRRGREVSFALASRMGLGRGPHRLSVAAELLVVLGAGLVVGSALALAAAALVAGRIDLLPAVAPHPTVWVPWTVLGGAAVAIVLAAALGAWAVQRGVDRAKVAEVIRLVD